MAYGRDTEGLTNKIGVLKDSTLRILDPFIDDTGLLRGRGRIFDANLPVDEKKPLIVPSHTHVT